MTLRYPPRREPRVLAVSTDPHRVLWTVADPWEIRGAGRIRANRDSQSLMVRRLLRREHPTVIVIARLAFRRLNARLGDLGVPVVPARFPAAPGPIAADLFPEIAVHAPTKALRKVAIQAISAVLHGQFPSRHYATSRHKTVLRPS